MCRNRSGRELQLSRREDTSPADVPYYVTDNTHVTSVSGWAPQRSVDVLLDNIFSWLLDERATLEPILTS